ncbi:hypothetical protein GCM10007160_26950 [Litchfieldella qijiaojingensis]|uniref:Transposase n=2 Tax=Litchfieldella qijiaojingensis TaxID=980347 RepID=A0ABQ2YYT9_9GAMM|nr:hypothetical protein GCM10007160_26950 [Halomonas qijiaojingensis]
MGQHWVDEECNLGDARLNRRLGMILEDIGERPDKSLPTAFQDWANTKAAYRFFANENVSEDKILEGHFAASALRIQATDGPILILQDTTEFSFKRSSPEKIGFTKVSAGRKMRIGKTHLASSIGYGLIEAGIRVKFVAATALVQSLQRAKEALRLTDALARLDKYAVLIIDDLGYPSSTLPARFWPKIGPCDLRIQRLSKFRPNPL